MKKFSNITNQKVGQEPVKKETINEEDLIRTQIISLMDNYLKVQPYGPTNRYTQNSTFKITGREIFVEAILALLNNENGKSNVKLLESLKYNIKDWDFIDSKIEENKINEYFKYKYRIKKIFDIYEHDEGLLMEILKIKIEKIKDKYILETYSTYIKNSSINTSDKEEIIEMINGKINK